jgi:two-component system, OmpR family, KDP operon response regulator KdpE
MSHGTILVVDDEPQIRRTLRLTLCAKGYEVIEAKTGQEAVECLLTEHADAVLLDMNLPDMSGIEACRWIRRSFQGPIIMVTVRNSEVDKIAALDAGADDYVVKPFASGELLARIRATRRRFKAERLQRIELPELTIDFDKRMVELRGRRIHLTPKEFKVLSVLATNHGKPITHEKLLHLVWGPEHSQDTENLRVVIKNCVKRSRRIRHILAISLRSRGPDTAWKFQRLPRRTLAALDSPAIAVQPNRVT